MTSTTHAIDYTGQGILVTGGTKGIGAAVCRAFQDCGGHVVAAHHKDHAGAHAFHSETHLPVVPWDLADVDQCHRMLDAIEAQYGPLSVYVHAAAVNGRGSACPEIWQDLWRTHVVGGTALMRAALHRMQQRGTGRWITITPAYGCHQDACCLLHDAIKGAWAPLIQMMARQAGPQGVTVNGILPGWIRTCWVDEMDPDVLERAMRSIPMRRLGTPQDVARASLFAASGQASFLTGALIAIDGGGSDAANLTSG